jgi:hypothetical protein
MLKELGLHDQGFIVGGPELALDKISKIIEWDILDRPVDHIRMFLGTSTESEEELDYENFYENRREAVRSMLDQYIECVVTTKLLRDISLHVAGNLTELRTAQPFKRWDGLGEIWAPLHVKDCHRIPSRRKRMYVFKVKSYGGPTTASEWTSVASAGRIRHMIVDSGMPKFGKYIPEDISGMWFTARMFNDSKGLQYADLFTTSSMLKVNKELMAARKEKCKGPYKPMRGRACAMCPAGKDICSNARLEKTWEKRECERGHIGYFDPDNKELTFCMNCVRTGDWLKKGD